MEAAPLIPETLENISAAVKGRVVVLAQNLEYVAELEALDNPRFRAVYSHRFLEMANSAFKAILADPVKLATLKNRRRPGMTQRHYTCLLNRARPHRLAMFGWLKRRGYLERGNVSFHGAECRH
ncbi:hypothetical protein [Allomesorhizobium camelthorni]|uniref:Uncharacterized protein n=1 Tax=Allomesorhizobium camelthorni TaxID=475069 RepID=A0A6G4WIN4_9HYPH|nr:hypothetical protein [Mesorhizobium camelthorni]NGO54218.1 hypothetical protein [Mesorhizobium camelthorni]